jgi:hypothetical protein
MSRELTEVCERIQKARDYYDQCKLGLPADQSEVLRALSVSYSELAEYRIEYHNKWLDAYNKAEGTNASKERTADNEVRELYLCRQIMNTTKELISSIRSTLSTAKNN